MCMALVLVIDGSDDYLEIYLEVFVGLSDQLFFVLISKIPA